MAVRLRPPGVGLDEPRRRKREDGEDDGEPADRPTRDAHTRHCSHSHLLTILSGNLPTRQSRERLFPRGAQLYPLRRGVVNSKRFGAARGGR